MQPELPEKCRKPSGYAAISGLLSNLSSSKRARFLFPLKTRLSTRTPNMDGKSGEVKMDSS